MKITVNIGTLKKPKLAGKEEAGFSLIELLVALAVSLILMIILVSYFIQNQKTYSSQDLIKEMQEYASSAMDFMIREIRQAGYGATTAINSANCSGSQLEINLYDDDDDEIKTIRYYVSNNKLIRRIEDNPDSLAENITSLTFEYCPALPSPQKITITLIARTAKVDPMSGSYRTFTLKSDVTIRNTPNICPP